MKSNENMLTLLLYILNLLLFFKNLEASCFLLIRLIGTDSQCVFFLPAPQLYRLTSLFVDFSYRLMLHVQVI